MRNFTMPITCKRSKMKMMIHIADTRPTATCMSVLQVFLWAATMATEPMAMSMLKMIETCLNNFVALTTCIFNYYTFL